MIIHSRQIDQEEHWCWLRLSDERISSQPFIPSDDVFDNFRFAYRHRVASSDWQELEKERVTGSFQCNKIGDLVVDTGEKIGLLLASDGEGYQLFLDSVPESTPLGLVEEFGFNV